MTRLSISRRRIGIVVALIIATPPAALAQSDPSPEAIRACVERNLVKYTNPDTAVVAQYADIETTCRAALGNGDVSVQFDPSGPADGQANGGSGPRDDQAAGTPSAEPRASGSSGPPNGVPNSPSPGRPSATQTSSSASLVAEAIAKADASAGSPLPSSIADVPARIYIPLGAAATLIVGAAGVALRRRFS